MNILIRADGSKKLGMGHIVRSTALAEEFIHRGHRVFFMVREDALAKKYIDNKRIDRISYISENNKLGYEQILSELEIHLFISDVVEYEDTFFSFLRKRGIYSVQLDILRKMDLNVDLLINGGVYAQELEEEAKKTGQKVLLGPKYNLLRREFAYANKKLIKDQIKHVLISLGATDVHGLTETVAHVSRTIFPNAILHIVYGGEQKDFERSTFHQDSKAYLYHRTSNMLELMEKADLAICSGGTMLYELATTATPALVITQAENQIRQTLCFYKYEAIIYYGKAEDYSAERFSKSLQVVEERQVRQKLSLNIGNIVDGKGVDRVVDHLLEELRRKD